MSANVGLSTPRGSGTSGYVQRNLSALNPSKKPLSGNSSNRFAPYPSSRSKADSPRHRPRQPDAKILAHDRARELEIKILELRDELEESGELEEEEIEKRCDALREELEKGGKGGKEDGRAGTNTRQLKSYQVHELARAKIEESEKLRRALGIRKDYEEGSHWRRQQQQQQGGSGATEERLKRGLKDEEVGGDVDRDAGREAKKSKDDDRRRRERSVDSSSSGSDDSRDRR